MIKAAEAAKAQIYTVPGNELPPFASFENSDYVHSMLVDEEYMMVGSHLEESIRDKIITGKYIDFAKLIPRDRIQDVEDGTMKMIVRNGQTLYIPYRDDSPISSFSKWEQAFRVFCNVYTSEFPGKSSQLIQYNHVIHSLSQTYIWDNMYAYDKDFRIHMSKHPQRNWSIILSQAWSMRLKDRLHRNSDNVWTPNNANHKTGNNRSEPCHRFNRGKCSYGPKCKYEHRCNYCFKMGHSIVNCRKLQADREKGVATPQVDYKEDKTAK